jgi:hypothetical protein
MNIEEYAERAARERFWSHTVGIINRALITHGTDPRTGLRGSEESPGMGVAGLWGERHFILTAKHVLEKRRLKIFRSSLARSANSARSMRLKSQCAMR